MKNKKILIFGENGFIGSHFYKKYNNSNIITKLNLKHNKNPNMSNFFYNKISNTIKKDNYDYIINFHAQTDINLSINEFRYDFYHNCSITHSIVESLIKNNSKSFFLNLGTVTQIGTSNFKTKINNNYIGAPETIFDLHKYYNENFINIFKKNYKIKATSLRLSNIYGISNTKSKNRGIFYKLIKKALKENVINIYGNGNYNRDFLYINDLLDGIEAILKNHNRIKNNYYYLNNGKSFTLKQFALILKKIVKTYTDKELKIRYVKWPNSSSNLDRRSFIGNNDEIKKIIDWKPKFTLEKGIEDIVRNYLNNKIL